MAEDYTILPRGEYKISSVNHYSGGGDYTRAERESAARRCSLGMGIMLGLLGYFGSSSGFGDTVDGAEHWKEAIGSIPFIGDFLEPNAFLFTGLVLFTLGVIGSLIITRSYVEDG
jgi:hypothetical protein